MSNGVGENIQTPCSWENKAAVDKLDDLATEKIEEKPEPSRDNPRPIRNR
jgi:hypothetical protein